MNGDGFTSFLCPKCGTEIEASMDMIGEKTECPACGAMISVPEKQEDGDSRQNGTDRSAASLQAMKSRTIRIELDDL